MMGQANVPCVLHLSCAEVQNPVLGCEGLGLSVSHNVCGLPQSVFSALLKVGTTSGFAQSEGSGSVSTVSHHKMNAVNCFLL